MTHAFGRTQNQLNLCFAFGVKSKKHDLQLPTHTEIFITARCVSAPTVHKLRHHYPKTSSALFTFSGFTTNKLGARSVQILSTTSPDLPHSTDLPAPTSRTSAVASPLFSHHVLLHHCSRTMFMHHFCCTTEQLHCVTSLTTNQLHCAYNLSTSPDSKKQ